MCSSRERETQILYVANHILKFAKYLWTNFGGPLMPINASCVDVGQRFWCFMPLCGIYNVLWDCSLLAVTYQTLTAVF